MSDAHAVPKPRACDDPRPWSPPQVELCLPEKGVDGRQQLRREYIIECESHCGSAPNSRKLLTLAADAMQRAPPAQRCARALLLQAHRLRKQVPRVGAMLKDTDETPLTDTLGNPGIPWPHTPADLPRGLLSSSAGVGGLDLSLGAEAVPLQWVNEVDNAVPPPIMFVRQCIDVDVAPDWRKNPARPCGTEVTATSKTSRGGDRCADATFPAGKPVGHCECNWACLARCATEKKCKCGAQCSRRALQRGGPFRLQVFRHKTKGWCLRTLEYIPAKAFVMEYVAERLTPARSAERLKDDPNIETYIMDLEKHRGNFSLDALAVRNHAAFAAFACSSRLANLKKAKVYSNLWDPCGAHVGFFSTRDIEPGEELMYLREDGNPNPGTGRICGCGHRDCAGYI